MLQHIVVESAPRDISHSPAQRGDECLTTGGASKIENTRTEAQKNIESSDRTGNGRDQNGNTDNNYSSILQEHDTTSENARNEDDTSQTFQNTVDTSEVSEKPSPDANGEISANEEGRDTTVDSSNEGGPAEQDTLTREEGPLREVTLNKDNNMPEEDGPPEPPYSVLSEPVKICIILTASFAAIISPISGSIYFPALNSLAHDLHVSTSLINLTITTYLIFQGLAPSFIGNFSDNNGRRPAYIICFVIYLVANIALALQNKYAALVALRCLQSSGSSGTIALGSAVVADVSTRAERGKYVGYATMGVTLGPALGPIIGGLLDQYLGWRAIFWFLSIFAAAFFIIVVLSVPETARTVVGNDEQTLKQRRRRTNPLTSFLIARDPEDALILLYGSLLYAGYFSILSTLSNQLQERYGLNSFHIGLCYLPLGFGSLTSRWTVGRILDRNFHRIAKVYNIPIVKNRQQDISKFPIEMARLQVSLPLVYTSCLCIVAYAWVMDYRTNLAGPLVMLFFTGHLVTGSFSALNTLIVDINRETPATAVAANNLFRCLMGAGATAVANPLIQRIGMGWTGTFVAFLWLVLSPALWAVLKFGPRWRAKARMEEERRKEKKAKKKARVDPKAREELSVETGREKTVESGKEKHEEDKQGNAAALEAENALLNEEKSATMREPHLGLVKRGPILKKPRKWETRETASVKGSTYDMRT